MLGHQNSATVDIYNQHGAQKNWKTQKTNTYSHVATNENNTVNPKTSAVNVKIHQDTGEIIAAQLLVTPCTFDVKNHRLGETRAQWNKQ